MGSEDPKERSRVCWDWESNRTTQWNRKHSSWSSGLSGEHQVVSTASRWGPQCYLTFGETEAQTQCRWALGFKFRGMKPNTFLGNTMQISSSLSTPWFLLSAGKVIPPSSHFFSRMNWLFGDRNSSLGETLQRRLQLGSKYLRFYHRWPTALN